MPYQKIVDGTTHELLLHEIFTTQGTRMTEGPRARPQSRAITTVVQALPILGRSRAAAILMSS